MKKIISLFALLSLCVLSVFAWGKNKENISPIEVFTNAMNDQMMKVAKFENEGKWQEAYDEYLRTAQVCKNIALKSTKESWKYFTTIEEAFSSDEYKNYEIMGVVENKDFDLQAEVMKITDLNKRVSIMTPYGNSISSFAQHYGKIFSYFNGIKEQKLKEKRAEEERLKAEAKEKEKQAELEKQREKEVKEKAEQERNERIYQGKRQFDYTKNLYDSLISFEKYYSLMSNSEQAVGDIESILKIFEEEDYENILSSQEKIKAYLNILIPLIVEKILPDFYALLKDEELASNLDWQFFEKLENGMLITDDEFLLYDIWKTFLISLEKYYKEHSYFNLSSELEQDKVNYEDSTFDYNLIFTANLSPIFKSTIKGFNTIYEKYGKKWSDIPANWGNGESIISNIESNVKFNNVLFTMDLDGRDAMQDMFKKIMKQQGFNIDNYSRKDIEALVGESFDEYCQHYEENIDLAEEGLKTKLNIYSNPKQILENLCSDKLETAKAEMNNTIKVLELSLQYSGYSVDLSKALKFKIETGDISNSLYYIKSTVKLGENTKQIAGFLNIEPMDRKRYLWGSADDENLTVFSIRGLSRKEYNLIRKGDYKIEIESLYFVSGDIDYTKEDLGEGAIWTKIDM